MFTFILVNIVQEVKQNKYTGQKSEGNPNCKKGNQIITVDIRHDLYIEKSQKLHEVTIRINN
jgi:hypothetical protein